jgi:hypothetical protein
MLFHKKLLFSLSKWPIVIVYYYFSDSYHHQPGRNDPRRFVDVLCVEFLVLDFFHILARKIKAQFLFIFPPEQRSPYIFYFILRASLEEGGLRTRARPGECSSQQRVSCRS